MDNKEMNVGRLIHLLSQFDPDLPVQIDTTEYSITPNNIELGKCRTIKNEEVDCVWIV